MQQGTRDENADKQDLAALTIQRPARNQIQRRSADDQSAGYDGARPDEFSDPADEHERQNGAQTGWRHDHACGHHRVIQFAL